MKLLEHLNKLLEEDGPDIDDFEEYVEGLHELIFDFIESFDYEELSWDQKEAADNIIEYIDDDYYEMYEDDEELDESRMKRVVRGGKVKRRLKPKKGYKVQDGRYVKISAQEKMKRRKGAKKAAKKRRTKKGAIQRKTKRSMRKRASRGL